MENIQIKEDGLIVMSNVKLLFPSVITKVSPPNYPNSAPKYSATLVLDKKKFEKGLKALREFSNSESDKFYGKSSGKSYPWTLIDGDSDGQNDRYIGTYRLTTSNFKVKPKLWIQGEEMGNQDDSPFVTGCYVDAFVNIYPSKFQKGMYYGLIGLNYRSAPEGDDETMLNKYISDVESFLNNYNPSKTSHEEQIDIFN